MVGLNTRERDVLLVLLRAEEPITAKYIASELKLTPRIVRYCLSSIKAWLSDRKNELLVKPNYGMYIDASLDVRRNLIQELSDLEGYGLVLSPQERFKILLLLILVDVSRHPLQSRGLEKRLGISHATLLKDVDRVEIWLNEHQLELIRRPGFGFKISGKEVYRREGIIDYLLEFAGETALLSFISGTSEALRMKLKGEVSLHREIRKFLKSLDLASADAMVQAVSYKLATAYTDSDYLVLVLQAALSIKFASFSNEIVGDLQALEEVVSKPEYQAVKEAVVHLEVNCGVEQQEQEICFLTIQFLGAHTRWTVSDIIGDRDHRAAPENVRRLIGQFLSDVSLYLHPSLQLDKQLAQTLAFHSRPALFRLRYGLPIRTAYLAEVKIKYPHIFRVTQKCSQPIAEYVGKEIPDEEIAIIAMQLAVALERLRPPIRVRRKVIIVCGEGSATAWLVVSRLQVEVPEIEVTEVLSLFDVSRRQSFSGEIDGIISTLPVNIPGMPVVTVSPMIDQRDKTKIRDFFQISVSSQGKVSEMLDPDGITLPALLTPDNIQVRIPAGDWEQVVDLLGSYLTMKDLISDNYLTAIKRSLRENGPYMVVMPGIALLHARPEEGVNKLCLGLMTLAKPVAFGHETFDPVWIAIILGAADHYSHLKALFELIELLRNKSLVGEILESESNQEVWEIINLHLSQGSSISSA